MGIYLVWLSLFTCFNRFTLIYHLGWKWHTRWKTCTFTQKIRFHCGSDSHNDQLQMKGKIEKSRLRYFEADRGKCILWFLWSPANKFDFWVYSTPHKIKKIDHAGLYNFSKFPFLLMLHKKEQWNVYRNRSQDFHWIQNLTAFSEWKQEEINSLIFHLFTELATN